ncbi:MAG TPA: hypothetical protein VLV83_23795, partial [Acidobacteriota bacterium]|nr:hypothetical protein [Acidobacteriota bacterium]
MALKSLSRRGMANTKVAQALDVTEGTVRYHLKRESEGKVDGRSKQRPLAADFHEEIEAWLQAQEDEGVNLAELHEWLREERRYPGSLRSLQRYFGKHFPQPRRRARRRVETPPGAQAQADWAVFRDVPVAGRRRDLYAFHLLLSFSRYEVVVFSEGKNQLCWHEVHNQALRRLDGGAGRDPGRQREDGCLPRRRRLGRDQPSLPPLRRDGALSRRSLPAGKVERRIREQRLKADPAKRHWNRLEELQEWTDERMLASAKRRICPATGDPVIEAFLREREHLGPLGPLPEPFDLVVTRRVARDCMVRFEGRSYSVPFQLIGKQVEVRGCAAKVQFLSGAALLATHPRNTRRRILIDPLHFEGEATDEVLPPPPLGRMGRKLEELRNMPPQQRPLGGGHHQF